MAYLYVGFFLDLNMTTKPDIATLDDIKLLVSSFYTNVQKDDLIGPIFNEKIGDKWPEHLEKMYRFWETILLEVHTYSGSPFPPHKHLPIDKIHFDRWMEVFVATVDRIFRGPIANEAKLRAKNMSEMFNYKINYFRDTDLKTDLLNIKKHPMRLLLLAFLTLTTISCSTTKQIKDKAPTLKYINTIEVPFNQKFKNTMIGGLSSIDYDPTTNLYYFISDDRSVYNDARFYTAKIQLNTDTISQVAFQNVITLKNVYGKTYSNWEKYPNHSIDPEEMRYNPKTKSVVWSSEGARVLAKDFEVIQNPTLQYAKLNGEFSSSFSLPKNLNMQKVEKGPRSNGVLEGITFNNKYSTLYTNVEEPLYDDDTQATIAKGGLIRIFKFDTKSRKNTAQYAYMLDPIARQPNPTTGFAVNGISTIQYYANNQLLVVERSYSTGKQACTIKVYLCELSKATDVKNLASLQNQEFKIASKKLILNMDDLNIFIDNIEGVTFGPKLANGQQTLLFVTDNNFSDKQKTQILLFAVE